MTLLDIFLEVNKTHPEIIAKVTTQQRTSKLYAYYWTWAGPVADKTYVKIPMLQEWDEKCDLHKHGYGMAYLDKEDVERIHKQADDIISKGGGSPCCPW